MTELDILDAIKSAKGKNDKATFLRAAKSDVKLQQLLDAAFNYKRKFFIKKWNGGSTSMQGREKHYDFMELLKFLESGEGRGDVAKAKVEEFFDMLDPQQKHWYERILKKDLKMGVSVDTAIKCGFDIPKFDVQLAKDGKKMKKLPEFVKRGGYASRKYDGYRCLAVVINGDVTLYSRNGTVYENFPSIEESLKLAFPVGKYVFDGEIMSDNFQSMQKSAFASKRDTTIGDVKYYMFDTIDYDEWNTQEFTTPKTERLAQLAARIKITLDDSITNLEYVQHKYVDDLDELLKLEKQYIQEGYEGVMFVPNIPYYLGKKSNKMIKLKTFVSQDVEIVGFELGDADGKYAQTLGKFIVKQEDGQLCGCGSGISDEDRDYIWANQNEFIGRIFEAAYQEETDDGKMRFPVFKRWRNDKEK